VINVVGFAGAVGQTVPIGATYIYRVNYFAGFIVASLSYYILTRIWPAKAVPERWTEDGDQDVIETRMAAHSPTDDDERANWKIDEEQDGNMFHNRKLHPSGSPSGSNY